MTDTRVVTLPKPLPLVSGRKYETTARLGRLGYTGGNGNSELIEIETVFMDSFSGYE